MTAISEPWRPLSLFVSSTFRDFQAERDHLQQVVFDELRELLVPARRHFEPIDLRIGVETLAHEAAEAKEHLVLKVCLDEIDRSRPFLIVLLGDRYGWVPPPERLSAAAQEKGYAGDLAGRSVTALEIEYGILDHLTPGMRCFFYFREPLPYAEMGPLAAVYSDGHGTSPDAPLWVERLAALKERIRQEYPDRVRTYTATWDAAASRVAGLDEFGKQVVADLSAELRLATADFARPVPQSWQEVERQALADFVEERGRGFVGREALLHQLTALAASPTGDGPGAGACVVGEAGAGKSSVFARLHAIFSQRDVLVLGHAAGVSVRSTSVADLLRRWVGELAASLGVADPLTDESTIDETEEAFASLTRRVSANRRVVLLVDALNQFEPTPRARHLTWLPKRLPGNVRLIATAIEGEESRALAGRADVELVTLPALTATDGEAIAREVYGRYHRTPNGDVVRAVLTRADDDGRLAAGNPLWLHLALEELNQLDADDFARTAAYPHLPEDARLRQMQLDLVAGMPPTVAGLYAGLLQRTEETVGEAMARGFASLIAVSRYGWREGDLRVLLPAVTGETWDDLRFARLRRRFRAHLVRRGVQEQYDFFHTQTREAVRTRYLADEAEVRRLHTVVVGHLEALPAEDALRQGETMVHMLGTKVWLSVAQYYGGLFDLSAELVGATKAFVEHVSTPQGIANAESVILAPELAADGLVRLCEQLLASLFVAIGDRVSRVDRRRLLDVVRGRLDDIRTSVTINDRLSCVLGNCSERLGDLAASEGDTDGALRHFSVALRFHEKASTQDPSELEYLRNASVIQSKLCQLNIMVGEFELAQSRLDAVLNCRRELLERDPENNKFIRGMGISHARLGELALRCGEANTGSSHFQRSLELAITQHKTEPSNEEYVCDVAGAYCCLGVAKLAQGDSASASEHFKEGFQIAERLYRQNPENSLLLRSLCAFHDNLSKLAEVKGDIATEREHLECHSDLTSRLLLRDSDNVDYATLRHSSYLKLGDHSLRQGDTEAARGYFQESLDLVSRFPVQSIQNTAIARALGISHSRLGELEQISDIEQAQDHLARTLSIRQRLYAQTPRSIEFGHDLYKTHDLLGRLALRLRKFPVALGHFNAGLDIIQQLCDREPNNLHLRCDLCACHLELATSIERTGEYQAAYSHLQAAHELAESFDQTADHTVFIHARQVVSARCGEFFMNVNKPQIAHVHLDLSLRLSQLLHDRVPTNAQFASALANSLFRLAKFHRNFGSTSVAARYRVLCRRTLEGMLDRRMQLDSDDETLLTQLRELKEPGLSCTLSLGMFVVTSCLLLAMFAFALRRWLFG